MVELAGLDRSSGGDLAAEIDELERLVQPTAASTEPHREEHA